MRAASLVVLGYALAGCGQPLPPYAPGLDGAGIDAARQDAGTIFVGNDGAAPDTGQGTGNDGGVVFVDSGIGHDAAQEDGSLPGSDGSIFTDAGGGFGDAGSDFGDAGGGFSDASGI